MFSDYPVLVDCRSSKLRFLEVGEIVQLVFQSLQTGHTCRSPLRSTRFRNCAKIEGTSSYDVPRRTSWSGMPPAVIRKEVK